VTLEGGAENFELIGGKDNPESDGTFQGRGIDLEAASVQGGCGSDGMFGLPWRELGSESLTSGRESRTRLADTWLGFDSADFQGGGLGEVFEEGEGGFESSGFGRDRGA
jgi:hypothetical protein